MDGDYFIPFLVFSHLLGVSKAKKNKAYFLIFISNLFVNKLYDLIFVTKI